MGEGGSRAYARHRYRMMFATFASVAAACAMGGCSVVSGVASRLGNGDGVSGGPVASDGRRYDSEEEAGNVALGLLKEKYGKTFRLTGTPTYGASDGGGLTFASGITDPDGLSATVTLPQDGRSLDPLGETEMTDTYSEAWYTKKARDFIEPYLRGKLPVDRYYVSLHNCGHAGADLGQSLDEFFGHRETWYEITVVMPDGLSDGEYVERIRETAHAIGRQPYPYSLSVYANGVNIYGVSLDERGTEYEDEILTDDEIGLTLDMSNDAPIPDEDVLRDPYYNG